VNLPGRLALRLFWRFRFDFLAILVVAAVMAAAVDYLDLRPISGIVPLMGVVVAIFIGFRNRNAYTRWWEARTLWASIVSNGRSLHYALLAYEDGTPEMAAITGRIRRREARHAWQLADELHGTPPSPRLTSLTPEDPAACPATELLRRQAVDIGELSSAGMIDRQARRVLVTINSAQVGAAAGLERIRSQPTPPFYAVVTRILAWFYAVVVCTGLQAGGHDTAVGILLSVLVMTLFVMAERVGSLLDEPMTDDDFGLPLDRFCASLTTDLLGPEHNLSRI